VEKRRQRKALAAAAVALMLAVVTGFVWSRSDSGSGVSHFAGDGDVLPTFKLKTLSGIEVTPEKYRGKPLVLNFWAVSCGPCRQEMPAFQRAADDFGSRITVIGLNVGDEADAAAEYTKSVKVHYEIVRDPNSDYFSRMAPTLPTTLFVSADGRLVSTHVGAMNDAEINDLINQAFG
jgi:thiol-disulfide isomerase/thioredoxin